MKRYSIRLLISAAISTVLFAAQHPVRLYVLDCGTLHIADMGRFQLTKEEVATTDLSVACFLISHPKGTLIWDTGAVPDAAWKPTGKPITQHILLPDSQQRDVIMVRSLEAQLAELRQSPSDVTYIAISHYHYDHTANSNAFRRATWLVRQVERDAMFAEKPPAQLSLQRMQPFATARRPSSSKRSTMSWEMEP